MSTSSIARWLRFGSKGTLGAVLKRALHADVKARYRSAGEFAGALTQYLLEADLCTGPAGVSAWVSETLGLLTSRFTEWAKRAWPGP